MIRDAIVLEVHEAREAYARKLSYNLLDAIFRDL
jgi:hypothetical protein